MGLTLLALVSALGETAAAIQHFDRALEIRPDCDEAITRKISIWIFLPTRISRRNRRREQIWWDAIGSKLRGASLRLGRSTAKTHRRWVCFFRLQDSFGAFAFLPVLRSHDKANFQINCYSSSATRDSLAAVFQSLADVWIDGP